MELRYVAFDSFGVKSMCLGVRTKDASILIDPGVAVETDSFPLSRVSRLRLYTRFKNKIVAEAEDSNIVIVTHYHYDHHICERSKRLYGGKTILLKDPECFINKSQRQRASLFLKTIQGLPKGMKVCDLGRFRLGKTEISFSRPFWHGMRWTDLGYVVMVTVKAEGEKLIYSSDVNGLYSKEATDYIIAEDPVIIVLDGPPTYLLGYIMAYYNLARSIINILRLLEETNAEHIILDHHLARDYRYRELLCEAYDKADVLGKILCTAAELQGREPAVLGGYKRNGPTKWKKWKSFRREDMESVLRNAVERRLIGKEWLKMLRRY
ncbi:MAG: MBL fold metallo-hydrolase [Candidatus Bathyarchaeia archaeon]